VGIAGQVSPLILKVPAILRGFQSILRVRWFVDGSNKSCDPLGVPLPLRAKEKYHVTRDDVIASPTLAIKAILSIPTPPRPGLCAVTAIPRAT